MTNAHHIAHSAPIFGEKYLILYMIDARKKPKNIADMSVRVISILRKFTHKFHLTSSGFKKK